ncbi:SOD3 [Mytilus edulis]|uniref:SOD3 n=1 Tax=Mytilus edulis TaxID=6550 RepID=A0A8S3S730_MYTED|nr:SOD3 [Mytilus edulis]
MSNFGTKRKEDDDRDHNSTFNCKKKQLSPSLMNQEDLDVIGVFYDTEVTAVTDLLKLLKNKKSRTSFPEVAQFFIGLTDEHLTFSLDLHNIPSIDEESAPAIEERELVEYLEEDSRNLEKFRLNEMKKWDYEKDALKFVQVHKCFPLNKRIYRTYGSSLIIKSPQLSPTPPTNERGTDRRQSVWMDDKIVGSINNNRYYEYIPRGAPNPVLLMFCEVKRFLIQASENTDTWINRKLPKTVLEQIHEGPDDLGMGGDAGSLKEVMLDLKVACCVIALADPATHDHLHSFNSDDQEGVAKHEGHTGIHIHEVKP